MRGQRPGAGDVGPREAGGVGGERVVVRGLHAGLRVEDVHLVGAERVDHPDEDVLEPLAAEGLGRRRLHLEARLSPGGAPAARDEIDARRLARPRPPRSQAASVQAACAGPSNSVRAAAPSRATRTSHGGAGLGRAVAEREPAARRHLRVKREARRPGRGERALANRRRGSPRGSRAERPRRAWPPLAGPTPMRATAAAARRPDATVPAERKVSRMRLSPFTRAAPGSTSCTSFHAPSTSTVPAAFSLTNTESRWFGASARSRRVSARSAERRSARPVSVRIEGNEQRRGEPGHEGDRLAAILLARDPRGLPAAVDVLEEVELAGADHQLPAQVGDRVHAVGREVDLGAVARGGGRRRWRGGRRRRRGAAGSAAAPRAAARSASRKNPR